MRNIALLPEKDRNDLFTATAEAMKINVAIVEKDFWVCWVLDYLFHDSQWKNEFAFKGGTSLSKAYNVIERFSEDIDLILDWRILGISDDSAWQTRSSTQMSKFCVDADKKAAEFIAGYFHKVLHRDLSSRANTDVPIIIDSQNVHIHYPRSYTDDSIKSSIRLEIGPLAEWIPNNTMPIFPYAANHFSHLFKQPKTMVRTISAERSFWEKSTILHQESHRSADKKLPLHYSRHYYDLYRLSISPICKSALSQLSLLEDVVKFKMRFYHCPWARYEDAKPGSLRLLPMHHKREIEKDYQDMQVMLFGMIPSFVDIMSGLEALEKKINFINI